ncbi:PatU [Nostoc sp. FACHB-87]|uniref:PatU n=1 Tax=Nostocaceae TaxID=1162 RepID=UPI0016839E7F|nr:MULTISPECIES: PatU [Nostocaceae]MBD2459133.1 PatU [Nostoc sp. FACHB-87]MBD2478672.1 PatU [Anabaena sp. FACHB-83]
MNSDSESLKNQLLTWLLADDVNTSESNLVEFKEIDGVDNSLQQAATFASGDLELGGIPQTFKLGDIPTVQDRFQAVLKRRLQTEIENQPPLFPWETQLMEYPERLEERSLSLVPAWGWKAQQSKLNLPINLPETVFRELLEKCQTLLTASLPLGAKLVQAVEDFFPQESSYALNDIAGLVLRSTYRSADVLDQKLNIESDYPDLQPRQQMALSLMAAKQLLENLSLPVTPNSPVVERQWLTSEGLLTLRVEYQSRGKHTQLRVEADLPTKGIVTLRADGTLAMAQSSSAGCLNVELSCQEFNPTYTLEVEFPEIDQQPLLFVINPTI